MSGVADAVHIAVYYIGTILLEYQERVGSTAAHVGTYRQGGSAVTSSGAGVGAPRQPANIQPGPGSAVQQFWIPDDLVGSSEYRLSSIVNPAWRLTKPHVHQSLGKLGSRSMKSERNLNAIFESLTQAHPRPLVAQSTLAKD